MSMKPAGMWLKKSNSTDTKFTPLPDDVALIGFSIGIARWMPSISDRIGAVPPDHDFVFKVTKDGSVTAVIDRKFDELSKHEVQLNWPLVEAAIRKEVASFRKLDTFKVIPRTQAINVMDSKFVLRWKADNETGQRVVKARITVRGFQDKQASSLETYASTASRWGQRFVVSTCVNHEFVLLVWDVSTAFLQGMDFDQLSATTGEEVRQVCFTPPKGAEKYFRELDNAQHYDPARHVLQMLKPVYGLKDAPRAWRLRLDAELRRLGGRPMLADAAIYVWFSGGIKLSAIISTHVDDLKGGGDPATMSHIKNGLTSAFGALAEKLGTFLHCGVQHEQTAEGDVYMDQAHYILQLHAADVVGLNQLAPSTPLNTKQQSDFCSLLGGLSWVCQTRIDIAVYVGALQRKNKAPTAEHLLRLNRVLKWIRRKPIRIKYTNLYKHAASRDPTALRTTVISDSAFRKEDAAGLAMRGFIVSFTPHNLEGPGGVMLFIEWGSKKQKRVCRSTYAAELNGLVDSYESGKVITAAATELHVPNLRPQAMIRLEESGKFVWPIECTIDAKSVFDSLANAEITPPTESALVFVLLVLKEALQCHTMRTLWWCDTRDMLSDGLNKGAVSRACLIKSANEGLWILQHDPIPFREVRHTPIIRDSDEALVTHFVSHVFHQASILQHESVRASPCVESDCWRRLPGNQWQRVHSCLRRALFTPVNTGLPFSCSELSDRRVTLVETEHGTAEELDDNWRDSSVAHLPLNCRWTGSTTFTRIQ